MLIFCVAIFNLVLVHSSPIVQIAQDQIRVETSERSEISHVEFGGDVVTIPDVTCSHASEKIQLAHDSVSSPEIIGNEEKSLFGILHFEEAGKRFVSECTGPLKIDSNSQPSFVTRRLSREGANSEAPGSVGMNMLYPRILNFDTGSLYDRMYCIQSENNAPVDETIISSLPDVAPSFTPTDGVALTTEEKYQVRHYICYNRVKSDDVVDCVRSLSKMNGDDADLDRKMMENENLAMEDRTSDVTNSSLPIMCFSWKHNALFSVDGEDERVNIVQYEQSDVPFEIFVPVVGPHWTTRGNSESADVMTFHHTSKLNYWQNGGIIGINNGNPVTRGVFIESDGEGYILEPLIDAINIEVIGGEITRNNDDNLILRLEASLNVTTTSMSSSPSVSLWGDYSSQPSLTTSIGCEGELVAITDSNGNSVVNSVQGGVRVIYIDYLTGGDDCDAINALSGKGSDVVVSIHGIPLKVEDGGFIEHLVLYPEGTVIQSFRRGRGPSRKFASKHHVNGNIVRTNIIDQGIFTMLPSLSPGNRILSDSDVNAIENMKLSECDWGEIDPLIIESEEYVGFREYKTSTKQNSGCRVKYDRKGEEFTGVEVLDDGSEGTSREVMGRVKYIKFRHEIPESAPGDEIVDIGTFVCIRDDKMVKGSENREICPGGTLVVLDFDESFNMPNYEIDKREYVTKKSMNGENDEYFSVFNRIVPFSSNEENIILTKGDNEKIEKFVFLEEKQWNTEIHFISLITSAKSAGSGRYLQDFGASSVQVQIPGGDSHSLRSGNKPTTVEDQVALVIIGTLIKLLYQETTKEDPEPQNVLAYIIAILVMTSVLFAWKGANNFIKFKTRQATGDAQARKDDFNVIGILGNHHL